MLNTPEAVETLIKAGADTRVHDNEGHTIFDYAQSNDKLKDSQIINKLRKEVII